MLISESLLPSVKYFKTNDFTYLSDHVQIELYLKYSITHETKTKLDEKRWKNILRHSLNREGLLNQF
jgi:predicted nucleic acid-binding protein